MERLAPKLVMVLLIVSVILFDTSSSLSMGLGKTLNLEQSKGFLGNAYKLNPLSEFEGELQKSTYQPSRIQKYDRYLEIDVRYSRRSEIPGYRHMFCSGYYCAFQYASKYN